MTAPPPDARPPLSKQDALALGQKLLKKGQLEKADRWTSRLVESWPDDPRTLNLRGLTLQRLNRPAESERAYRKAVISMPDVAEMWGNLGNAQRYLGMTRLSLRSHEKAVMIRPMNLETIFGLAVDHLARGAYGIGFNLYEYRMTKQNLSRSLRMAGMSIWFDQPVAGKSVLLVAEQGVGDTIQFVRFARQLTDLGARVSVKGTPGLTRLLTGADGVAEVVEGRTIMGDLIEVMMSLPVRLGIDLETLPAPRRYIEPPGPPPIVLPSDGPLRVGIAWAGNPGHQRDAWRSMPADLLAPLVEIDGVSFYSLQVKAPATNRMSPEMAGHVVDLEPHVGDFADTAALIDQLDLVITIDSSVAHVAGALGVPCWIMLSYVTDWRWLKGRDDSPWYPSVRLFRQKTPGDWQDVVARVAEALSEKVGSQKVSPEKAEPEREPAGAAKPPHP